LAVRFLVGTRNRFFCMGNRRAKIMAKNPLVQIGPFRQTELEAADRIVRLAYGTFLGLPNPMDYMSGREFVSPRWRSRNTKVLAGRENGKLIGLNVVTRWGSFGLFGPLAVLPDYWNRGVAQQLLATTMKVFDQWGVRHRGLFTFPNSPTHVGLYQKFGYWPGYLTAIMKRAPAASSLTPASGAKVPVLLSALSRSEREQAIEACAKLTNRFERGLDLSLEIRAVVAQRIGEVLLLYDRNALHAFAIFMHGRGSEGGENIGYVKFAAASSGEHFERLLDAIDALALARGVDVETGVSTACTDAFERMLSRGYRMANLGVAMQCPRGEGFTRTGAYVLGDWR
jgi:GNAT superfamily N-acetyltransferase